MADDANDLIDDDGSIHPDDVQRFMMSKASDPNSWGIEHGPIHVSEVQQMVDAFAIDGTYIWPPAIPVSERLPGYDTAVLARGTLCPPQYDNRPKLWIEAKFIKAVDANDLDYWKACDPKLYLWDVAEWLPLPPNQEQG